VGKAPIMNPHQEQISEKVIALFKSNNNEYDLDDAITQFENNSTEKQFYRQQLIITYKLVERKSGSLIYHLTEKGIIFQGFDDMRNRERLNKEASDKLLWYNTENAKAVFDDYPNIKSRSNLTIIIAAASMLLSALSLIKSCSR
jgi:hypothetical protein